MNTLEIVGLVLLSLLAFCTVSVLVCRSKGDPLLVSTLRTFNRLLMRVVHRLQVFDAQGVRIHEALPETGPFILVANHRSGADPMMVVYTTRRWIWFMMAREYYEQVKWLFSNVGCIPVNRDGSDLSSTRQAIKALRTGHVIGIFPQGGIIENDEDIDFNKAGVALLASRTDAPVVPMFIAGSPMHDNVFKATLCIRSRSRIYCGEPLKFESANKKPSREELDAFTERLQAAVLDLRSLSRAADADLAESDSKKLSA